MPTEQIFFGNDQRSGDQQIAGASPLAYNVMIDGAGAVRRRPGIVQWPDMTSGFGQTSPLSLAGASYGVPEVNGISSFNGTVHYVTAPKAPFLTTAQQHLTVNPTTGVVTGHLAGILGIQRPAFATTQFRLVCAAGAGLNTFAGSGGLSEPTSTTQVAALASRLMSNDNTSATTRGRILYSGVGQAGNLVWGALSFVTAEARPDALVALKENSNELFAFGESTLQVFTPDPISVLAPGRAINRGCLAAHSVILADESFAWFDDQSQFVMSEGRSMDVISDPIAETLDDLSGVSDVWGFRYNEGQFDCLVWVCPTDGRTFAYQKGGGWSQWSTWDGTGHARFAGTAHYYFPNQRRHLVGLPMEGIGYLDLSAGTDYVPNETGSSQRLIKAEVTTGFNNRGTDARKVCQVVRLTVKPGTTSSATVAPEILLSWRDDPNKPFCNPRRVSLGTMGSAGMTKELRTLGIYRSRQWKVEFTGDSEFVLARVEETFEPTGGN